MTSQKIIIHLEDVFQVFQPQDISISYFLDLALTLSAMPCHVCNVVEKINTSWKRQQEE